MGYYVGYQRDLMPANQIEWNTLTHLVVGPVTPRADGTLDTTFDIDATPGSGDGEEPGAAGEAARRRADADDRRRGRARRVRCRRDESPDALVDNLVATMHSYGFAGLDLDWEPIDSGDQPHVTALVNMLRDRLPNAVLTMPVMWVTKTFPTVPRLLGTMSTKLDRDRRHDLRHGRTRGTGWKSWHSSALTGAGVEHAVRGRS